MSFINDNFMISNARGVALYRDVAKELPIIDYHCHLVAKDIFEINRWRTLPSFGLQAITTNGALCAPTV